MTNFFRHLATMIAISFLTACGTVPQTQVVTKTVYVLPTVPEKFFDQKRPDRPMSRELYLQLSEKEKETYLTSYIQTLLQSLASCQADVFSIQKVLKDSKKAVDHENQSGN